MTQLHQILAKDKDTKAHLNRVVTDYYHTAQKAPLFSGMVKTYQPNTEDGDMLPAESVLVQQRTGNLVDDLHAAFTRLFNLRATIDVTNLQAMAPVVINGITMTASLPTTHLLFLEKQVNDIATIVEKLPTLDPAQIWHWNDLDAVWQTEEIRTARTVKVEEFVTVAPATEKHPAQVAKMAKDVQAGIWTTRKLSGAIPATQKAALLARIAEVKSAVKVAITVANSTNVQEATSGEVLDYIFRP